jgi:phosphohistidine swiveling domain-containing protein
MIAYESKSLGSSAAIASREMSVPAVIDCDVDPIEEGDEVYIETDMEDLEGHVHVRG